MKRQKQQEFERLLKAVRLKSKAAARALVFHLAKQLALRMGARLRLPRTSFRSPDPIAKLSSWICRQPFQEAAYYISCVYAVKIGDQKRKAYAMYFTPPDLANHIVSHAYGADSQAAGLHVLDPACGGSAFLLPVVCTITDKMRRERSKPREIVRYVREHICGIERDPVLAKLSQLFLEMSLAPELAATGESLKGIIRVGDALALSRAVELPFADLVLCNPPYRKVSSKELRNCRKHFGDIIEGQPNLYSLFMRMVVDALTPGGAAALLTPASYHSGTTFARLRRFVFDELTLDEIHHLHERGGLFAGVQHDLAVLFARRIAEKRDKQVISVRNWTAEDGCEVIGSFEVTATGSWYLPRDGQSSAALKLSQGYVETLHTYGYRARVGAYVWNRDRRRKRKSKPSGIAGERVVPVLWATYITQDGKFVPENGGSREQGARFIQLKRKDIHGLISSTCILLQRTSSRKQRKRLVATIVPSKFFQRYPKAIAENHVVIIEPINQRPRISLRALCKLLNSPAFAHLYSASSGTSAVTVGGLHQLPLPAPPNKTKAKHPHRRQTSRLLQARSPYSHATQLNLR